MGRAARRLVFHIRRSRPLLEALFWLPSRPWPCLPWSLHRGLRRPRSLAPPLGSARRGSNLNFNSTPARALRTPPEPDLLLLLPAPPRPFFPLCAWTVTRPPRILAEV